jgi:hypothetical protein
MKIWNDKKHIHHGGLECEESWSLFVNASIKNESYKTL